MKNISIINKDLYYISIFNKKYYNSQKKEISFEISCPLIQTGFHKKNYFNFIYFLFFISNIKPKLRIAKSSNALLKVRKGALIESFFSLQNFQELKTLFFFLDLKSYIKEFKTSLYKNISINNSWKLKLIVESKNLHFLQLLLGQSFFFHLIFKFPHLCKKKQLFFVSTL